MQSYSQQEAIDKYSEVFDKATAEPVLLTQESQPTHVLMSADEYQHLVNRVEELEDLLLAQEVKKANCEATEFTGNDKLALSERDSKYFISVMENPPEPSQGLCSLFD